MCKIKLFENCQVQKKCISQWGEWVPLAISKRYDTHFVVAFQRTLLFKFPLFRSFRFWNFSLLLSSPKGDFVCVCVCVCVCVHGEFGIIHSGYCSNGVILSMKQDNFHALWKPFSHSRKFGLFPFWWAPPAQGSLGMMACSSVLWVSRTSPTTLPGRKAKVCAQHTFISQLSRWLRSSRQPKYLFETRINW